MKLSVSLILLLHSESRNMKIKLARALFGYFGKCFIQAFWKKNFWLICHLEVKIREVDKVYILGTLHGLDLIFFGKGSFFRTLLNARKSMLAWISSLKNIIIQSEQRIQLKTAQKQIDCRKCKNKMSQKFPVLQYFKPGLSKQMSKLNGSL